MTIDELIALVANGESETVEFKRTTGERDAAARTLCGMLNQRGGRVVFGVSNDGRLLGQQLTAKSMEDVSGVIQLIDPPVMATMDAVDLDNGHQALVIAVDQGSRQPYAFRGRMYRRVGASTTTLTQEQANQLLIERLHGSERWETEPAPNWRISDLDTTEIGRTLEEAIRRGRAEDPGTRNPEDILRGLRLMRGGVLFRAAVMLFGGSDRLASEFPQCLLRVARFRGIDKSEFIDNKQFQGNAFDLLLRAERYLRENLPVAGRIVPSLFERQDDPLYPPEALREALANAFCHRDYSIGGGSVGIAIFDDRLEITSSGPLHFGLKVADLYRPHESLPWNPFIASVFFRRGVTEAWGRGTLKMAELTERAGLPRPEIEEIPGAVLVRFRPSRYIAPRRIGHDLTERQQTVLNLFGSYHRLALRDLLALMPGAIPATTLRDDLLFLKHLGLIDNAGHGRGAVWFLHGEDASPDAAEGG